MTLSNWTVGTSPWLSVIALAAMMPLSGCAPKADPTQVRGLALSAAQGAIQAHDALDDLGASLDPTSQGVRDFSHESAVNALQLANAAYPFDDFGEAMETSLNVSLMSNSFFEALGEALAAHDELAAATVTLADVSRRHSEAEAHNRQARQYNQLIVEQSRNRTERMATLVSRKRECEDLRQKVISRQNAVSDAYDKASKNEIPWSEYEDAVRENTEASIERRRNSYASKGDFVSCSVVDTRLSIARDLIEANAGKAPIALVAAVPRERLESATSEAAALAAVAKEKIDSAERLWRECMEMYAKAAAQWQEAALAVASLLEQGASSQLSQVCPRVMGRDLAWSGLAVQAASRSPCQALRTSRS